MCVSVCVQVCLENIQQFLMNLLIVADTNKHTHREEGGNLSQCALCSLLISATLIDLPGIWMLTHTHPHTLTLLKCSFSTLASVDDTMPPDHSIGKLPFIGGAQPSPLGDTSWWIVLIVSSPCAPNGIFQIYLNGIITLLSCYGHVMCVCHTCAAVRIQSTLHEAILAMTRKLCCRVFLVDIPKAFSMEKKP